MSKSVIRTKKHHVKHTYLPAPFSRKISASPRPVCSSNHHFCTASRPSKHIMSAKAIREYHGKRLVSKWISDYGDYDMENRCVQVGVFHRLFNTRASIFHLFYFL